MAGNRVVTMEGFCIAIKSALQRAFPECTLEICKRTRNNGVQGTCLLIKSQIFHACPEIPLEKFYQDYMSGQPLLTISLAIAALYEESRSYSEFSVEMLADYNQVKQRICYALINKEKNKQLLKDIPHICFLDLAIIFFIPVRIIKHNMDRIIVRNFMMKKWGISDPKRLYKAAHKNTSQILGGQIASANSIQEEAILKGDEINPDTLEDILALNAASNLQPLFAATNDVYLYGAAVILYEKILKSFAEMIEDNIIILPSSIHETMLIPAKCANIKRHRETVANINMTLDKEEILSDNIYLYDRSNDKISIIQC